MSHRLGDEPDQRQPEEHAAGTESDAELAFCGQPTTSLDHAPLDRKLDDATEKLTAVAQDLEAGRADILASTGFSRTAEPPPTTPTSV